MTRAAVSQFKPEAHAICDRCGFRYLHKDLKWQFQWRGPRLQNIRILVCQECIDLPQEQLRTIVLPPDPVPIEYARPENYVAADNPLSVLGANASPAIPVSAQIGTLTGAGGLASAFNGTINKPAWMCASNSISNSSYGGWVGINWGGDVSGITTPSSLMAPVLRHTVTSFAIYAPNDRSFLGNAATTYVIQGSPVLANVYGAWTTIATGTTAGTNGESISGTTNNSGAFQFHRVAFLGNGTDYVSVAQVQFNVGETRV